MKMKSIIYSVAAASIAMMGFDAMACTNLLAGKNATIDGSVLISYAADSHTLYGDLQYLPAADHKPGDMREIREWDTGKHLGYIPEVAHTYAVVGNINEHQVTVAESTFGGRHELADTTKDAIIDYGSLIYLALQRSRTAREAIKVMTDLVAKYGYCSEGESFSIGDPNELWVMEMIGKGGKEKGAVWVAIRIPDDCISAHANQSRIYRIPLKDKQNCMYSKDVISFARKMGYFSGKDEDFEFSRAYSPADFGTLRGCDARAWSYFNRFKSGMDAYLPFINGKKGAEVMPLYVKPDRKLSCRDVQNMMRDHFEGTPFDMTKDPGAKNYFDVPYRYRPMDFTVNGVKYSHERAIATQQTGWVFVSQMRANLPDPVGGCLWFGVDDANTAVYVPMYCSINSVPNCFSPDNGDMYNFSWTSAFWVHNWVANMAYNRYNPMIGDIRKVQGDLENQFEKEVATIDELAVAMYNVNEEAAREMLTTYSCSAAEYSTTAWKELGEFLMVKFLDGNVKSQNPDGSFVTNEYGLPDKIQFPGYSQEYYEWIVSKTGNRLLLKEVK